LVVAALSSRGAIGEDSAIAFHHSFGIAQTVRAHEGTVRAYSPPFIAAFPSSLAVFKVPAVASNERFRITETIIVISEKPLGAWSHAGVLTALVWGGAITASRRGACRQEQE
jgi:hypothetical protein